MSILTIHPNFLSRAARFSMDSGQRPALARDLRCSLYECPTSFRGHVRTSSYMSHTARKLYSRFPTILQHERSHFHDEKLVNDILTVTVS